MRKAPKPYILKCPYVIEKENAAGTISLLFLIRAGPKPYVLNGPYVIDGKCSGPISLLFFIRLPNLIF